MLRSICLMISLLFMLSGCATKYNIGYSLNPLSGYSVKYKTPVIVRELVDRRPPSERFKPLDVREFKFVSSDTCFNEPVAQEISHALKLELANAGVEVADPENFMIDKKPYLRVYGDVIHFSVTRQVIPVGNINEKIETLWQRERFTVKVAVNIEMVDTLQKKHIMERTYTSSDSVIIKTDMLDASKEGFAEKESWNSAGNQYCIQLLNDHLKYVLTNARRDIISLIAPEKAPKSAVKPALELELGVE